MTDPTPAEDSGAEALEDRATAGPFDESEANPVRPYIDIGGIKILPREGLNLRLEVEEREGPLGAELLAEVPVIAGPDGTAGKRLARFVGVDGPRWFLRGVIGGAATADVDAAAKVEDLFRSIVVVRGGSPMPPRDLIPLKMPATPGTA